MRISDSDATITWTMAPRVDGYAITIREVGTHRSYGQEQVLGDRWTAPYGDFPGYGKFKKGYWYQACSIVGHNTHAACTSTRDVFYVHAVGGSVSTSNRDNAAHKASSCLARGAKAAIVTAAGSGTLARQKKDSGMTDLFPIAHNGHMLERVNDVDPQLLIETDGRARVVIPGRRNERFLVHENEDGSLLLQPAIVLSAAQHEYDSDPELRELLSRATAARTVRRSRKRRST